MQAVEQHIRVPADRELRICLPPEAVVETQAEVIVLFQESPVAMPADETARELAEFRAAANDPLFMADLYEVMDDFKYADFDSKTL
ncbi:MAG: hypothetical protein HYR56_16560 [Acidobacteria bacterium]|nr:hypothetical protein [Acidobacteriota bacterium]MBI3425854.1 hypothetical protein [Acidobacteriota bacterium]